jgi:hypothetical protein
MQALIEKIFENKFFLFVASALALLLVVALILFIFRLTFGRRLKTTGGARTRLPRLGIVDAFNLDRHRQLVIVRRDNVEHLLMIGGPNDLVIESEIVRAEGRDVRLRDKEAREKEPREALQPPVHAPAPGAPPWQPEFDPAAMRLGASQPHFPRKAPIPPLSPVAAAPEPDAPPPGPVIDEPVAQPTTVPPPAPRPPAFPLPARRVAASPPPAQRAPREPLGRPDFSSRIEAGPGPSNSFPRAPLATPFLRPSPPRQPEEPRMKPFAAPAQPASASPAAIASASPESNPDPIVAASAAILALSETASAPSDGAGGPSQKPSTPLLAAKKVDRDASPFEAASEPSAAPSDKLADDLQKPSPPGARERPLGDPSIMMPTTDSLDDSLEEEMARLLGRGS